MTCTTSIKKVKKLLRKSPKKDIFLPLNCHPELCRCADCGAGVYAGRELEFLLDPEDTVHHYEAKGKEEQGQCAFSQLFNLIKRTCMPFWFPDFSGVLACALFRFHMQRTNIAKMLRFQKRALATLNSMNASCCVHINCGPK